LEKSEKKKEKIAMKPYHFPKENSALGPEKI